MTPTVIAALRCALRDLWHYDGCGCNTCVPVAEAIVRAEQELAAKDAEIARLKLRNEFLSEALAAAGAIDHAEDQP